uniref:START domain-containing protein 10 n=1 Tax=Parascaris univalens TaxID=6257 RepID=A0A915ARU5_PARUN
MSSCERLLLKLPEKVGDQKGVDDAKNGQYSGVLVNQVKILEDADFLYIKNLFENNDDWACVYDKKTTKVWTRNVPTSDFCMIKANCHMPDVSASVAYDVLHDPLYRPKWDHYMLNAEEVGLINPNNDICYYAVGGMPPFRSRDFVMQRSWLDTGHEKFICSHSVCHEKYPPVKGYVRGVVFFTAYLIREADVGCHLMYATHSDPKGKLPAWLINRLTRVIGPRMLKKLHKACLKYPAWKASNQPTWKPWIYPEQQASSVRINLSDCQPRNYEQELIDESSVDAKDVNDDDVL